jgi:hypothetical protein
MSARPQRIEVITRGERRRCWSLEEKQAIVVESTGLLYAWRHQLLGRRSGEAACFARVDVMSEPHLLTGPGTAASTQRGRQSTTRAMTSAGIASDPAGTNLGGDRRA